MKTKTFYASKTENEEIKQSKTKSIPADVFAASDHLDVKTA